MGISQKLISKKEVSVITKMRILEAGNSWQHGKRLQYHYKENPVENGGTASPFSPLPLLQEEGIHFSSSSARSSRITLQGKG